MSKSSRFLPDKTVVLPSGRSVVLKSIEPEKALAHLGPASVDLSPESIKNLTVSRSMSDPEFLVGLITFLLSEGVENPRIVAKASVDSLAPDEIRFQDVGNDLLALLEAIGRYNQHTDLLNALKSG